MYAILNLYHPQVYDSIFYIGKTFLTFSIALKLPLENVCPFVPGHGDSLEQLPQFVQILCFLYEFLPSHVAHSSMLSACNPFFFFFFSTYTERPFVFLHHLSWRTFFLIKEVLKHDQQILILGSGRSIKVYVLPPFLLLIAQGIDRGENIVYGQNSKLLFV